MIRIHGDDAHLVLIAICLFLILALNICCIYLYVRSCLYLLYIHLLTQLANATQSVCLIDQQQEQSTLLFDCVCSKAWGRAGESIHLEKR